MIAPAISTLAVTSSFMSTSLAVSLLRGVIYLKFAISRLAWFRLAPSRRQLDRSASKNPASRDNEIYTNNNCVRTITIR